MSNGYGYGVGKMGFIENYKCIRTASLWAGWLSLWQSLAWIGLTIVGIIAYNCDVTVNTYLTFGSLMQNVFISLYFGGSGCRQYQSYNQTMLHSVHTVLDPEDVLIWECVYLGVATCWFIASVLLLAYVKKDNLRSTTAVLWVWIITILCINLMDLALGIIFGIDYGNFNIAAYGFNLDSAQAGSIDPNAAQLVAATVAAISMMIISFKGFFLWLVNVNLMVYLLVKVISVSHDKDGNDTLFMPRKESDDILTTRAPIKAYEEDITTTSVYANDAFVSDSRSAVTVELNQEAIARAARMSTDASLHDRRFRNVDAFQQYPPPRYNNNNSNVKNNNISQKPELLREETTMTTPISAGAAVSSFPAPDYTPPMSRANQGQNGILRNQRY